MIGESKMMRFILFLHLLLIIIVPVTSSPVTLNFEVLLDPRQTQVSLQKLTKVAEAVGEKRSQWELELKQLESEMSLDTSVDHRILHDSLQSLKSTDYKEFLENFGKLRLSKERGIQLKENIIQATSFLQTLRSLCDLLQRAVTSNRSTAPSDSPYLQFSEIRTLVKTLRGLSFDLFKPDESNLSISADLGEICIDILNIRRPTVDMKTDYKEFCF